MQRIIPTRRIMYRSAALFAVLFATVGCNSKLKDTENTTGTDAASALHEEADIDTKKKKRVFHAFEVNPDEPCDHCEERFCTKLNGKNLVELCYKGEHGELCKALVECAHKTKCGKDKAADCYCEKDAGITECMSKGGQGPCASEAAAAALTEDASIIAVRYADPAYPVGRAMAVVDCKRAYCPKCNQ